MNPGLFQRSDRQYPFVERPVGDIRTAPGRRALNPHDDDYDPFEAFTRPPPDETPDERAAREKSEYEAILRSKLIDAELRTSKHAMKRHQKAIKVLVLGQSLSGKSTTIKNFQMTYAHKSWSDERLSWKAVILLNLVHMVNVIVDILNDASSAYSGGTDALCSASSHTTRPTEQHKNVILRLSPIRQIEKDLKGFLGADSSEIGTSGRHPSDGHHKQRAGSKYLQEFCVLSSSGWKAILRQIRDAPGKGSELYDVARHVVAGCDDDIQWLWKHPITQKILLGRQLRLEESPGFFLDDTKRISALDYEPSDQDILRARLRTTGVQEYHFAMDKVNGTAIDWIMYDVAGIRTARATWVPYFKEATALIFLAPVSGFDECLIEDDSINRLEDTLLLWRTICASKLLANVELVLFMNKTDLLREKLKRGIQIKKYIPEYDKANDFETVAKWLQRVFKKIHQDVSPPESSRNVISHFTSVVDSESTGHTLHAVQEAILRKDFTEAGLM